VARTSRFLRCVRFPVPENRNAWLPLTQRWPVAARLGARVAQTLTFNVCDQQS